MLDSIYMLNDTLPSILEGTWVIDSFNFNTFDFNMQKYYAVIKNNCQYKKMYVTFNKHSVYIHESFDNLKSCTYEGLFHLSNQRQLDYIYIPHGRRMEKYLSSKKKFPIDFIKTHLYLFDKNILGNNCSTISTLESFSSLLTSIDSVSIKDKYSIFYSFTPTFKNSENENYQIYTHKIQ